MYARGTIRNRTYANQLRDFSGLVFGRISPTDIDGFIDFGNKAFVIIEMKHVGAELPVGQRLALERLSDAVNRALPCMIIVAEHDTEGDIDVANSSVALIRYRQGWKPSLLRPRVRAVIDSWLAHLGLSEYRS